MPSKLGSDVHSNIQNISNKDKEVCVCVDLGVGLWVYFCEKNNDGEVEDEVEDWEEEGTEIMDDEGRDVVESEGWELKVEGELSILRRGGVEKCSILIKGVDRADMPKGKDGVLKVSLAEASKESLEVLDAATV